MSSIEHSPGEREAPPLVVMFFMGASLPSLQVGREGGREGGQLLGEMGLELPINGRGLNEVIWRSVTYS